MSSALAIAAAARVVAKLLDNRVADEGLAVFQNHRTSVLSPEQIDSAGNGGGSQAVVPQLNLFPYHFGLNQAWRNRFEPSADQVGRRIGSVPLVIDISFLVSAHSSTALQPEILLGLAMQAIHDNQQLTRERVRTLLEPPAPPNPPDPIFAALQRSRLADQFELIRIVPLNLSPSEMQNLWTALHSRYRPSFCYMVSAMLIDSRQTGRAALPVREYASTVIQFVRPYIDRIEPANVVFSASGNTIMLQGDQLRQTGVLARFHTGQRQPILSDGWTETQARVQLPPDLRAGIVGVELVRPVEIGAPPPKEVNESNVGVFIHQPVFRTTGAPPRPDIVLGAVDNTNPPAFRPLRIRLQPAAVRGQDTKVMLTEVVASGVGRGFTFPGELGADPANDPVTFRLIGVPNGTYLVRVRVDGADTPLTVDASGVFDGPIVQVS